MRKYWVVDVPGSEARHVEGVDEIQKLIRDNPSRTSDFVIFDESAARTVEDAATDVEDDEE